MFALMRFEIRKFLARKRNLAGFGVILLMTHRADETDLILGYWAIDLYRHQVSDDPAD